MTLESGRKYNPESLTFTGWTEGDGTGHEGYNAYDYFAADGTYLGPDQHGIEPICDASEEETITVCLLGDDRERDYPVTYTGTADFPRWEREDGSLCGELPVALIRVQEDREALVAKHPDYGWCSVNDQFCRDFSPSVPDNRLQAAI